MRNTLVIIATLFIHFISFSQPAWVYTEQFSGVNTNLTSASTNGPYVPAQGWICGNGGIVLRTSNSGANWFNVGVIGGIPNTTALLTICCINTDTVLTAGIRGTTTYVYRTVNSGANWVQVFSQPNGVINAIAFKNSQLGYMVGNPIGGRWSLWKTTDKGATWDSTGMYIPQAGNETGFPNSITARHNYVFFGTNNSRIYRSTNNGLNWSFLAVPELNTSAIWMYTDTSGFPPPQGSFLFCGGSKLFKTTNAGLNWNQSSCPDSLYNFVGFCPGFIAVLEATPECAYAVRANNKIYFAGFGVNYFVGEYTAPLGTYNHISTDKNKYSFSPGYSFAVRSNGGITRVDYFRGGGIRQLSGKIPETFEIEQNYPNPFNPVTFIRFAVKNYGLVKLTVFDITGKEIAVPVNELLKPGVYEASWYASQIGSGVYFYRFVADGFTQTQKMILVK